MQRYRYSLDLTVRGFECDAADRLRPAVALRYLQEAATGHLDSLGLGYRRLYDEGMFFVLIGQGLRVLRAPRRGERITIATAPVAAQGARMFRETVLLDETGALLCENQTAWALLALETGRPMRSSRFPHELPMLRGEWRPFADPSRLKIPDAEEACGDRLVRLSDLDVNEHMNNTVYADVALDCFADPLLGSGGVDTLLLRYQRQARLGETMTLRRGQGDSCFWVDGRVDGAPCFSAQFSLKALETGGNG